MSLIQMILCGMGIGLTSGLLGIGGGTMLVPMFVFVFGMTMHQAVGTSLAVIIPMSLVGAFSHHLRGNVNIHSVGWIALGCVIGIFFSGYIIKYIPAAVLRKGFAFFLIFVAIRLLIKK